MIKNEKQYNITKKKLLGLREEIAQLQNTPEQLPAKDRLILASMMYFQEQLEQEIIAYDILKKLKSPILEERNIDFLPNLLIEFKIKSGMTHKEFAKRLGMKEQQLQRYEAESFKSISFKNLLKIFHAVGLEITVKGKILDETGKKQSDNNQSFA